MTRVLLMIDVQRNMLHPPSAVPSAAQVAPAIEAALTRARSDGDLVVHVRNVGDPGDPDEPNSPGFPLVHDVLAGEPVLDKLHADAFAGTGLDGLLPDACDLLVVGMQSDHCVRATVLSALDLGHSVRLGAHATYDAQGMSAAEISRLVEEELLKAGATLA